MSGPESPLGRWGEAWVRALEETALDTARLERGRAYARDGGVAGVRVERGRITAYVYGSRPRPYRAELRLPVLTPAQWDTFLDTAAEQPAWVAALLDGEVPHEVATQAEAAGARLLPGPGDLLPTCTCPDRGRPCKHVAALCYEVAAQLDADPFTLLLARGMPKPDVQTRLHRRARRHGQAHGEADPRSLRSPWSSRNPRATRMSAEGPRGSGGVRGARAGTPGTGGDAGVAESPAGAGREEAGDTCAGAEASARSGEADSDPSAGTAGTGKEAARAAARRARTGNAETDGGASGASASQAGARARAVGKDEGGGVAGSRSGVTDAGAAAAQVARMAARRARGGGAGVGAGGASARSGAVGTGAAGPGTGAAREDGRGARSRDAEESGPGSGAGEPGQGEGGEASPAPVLRSGGGFVPATEALAASVRPPLPEPLPALEGPGEPGPFPDVPGGPSPDGLAFLAMDAATRAHRALTARTAPPAPPARTAPTAPSADPLTELSMEHDIIRLAATHPRLTGRRTLSPLFAGLARTAGCTAPELARAAAAWRQGEAAGLTVLEEDWDPPAGDFDRARSILAAAGISVSIRRNHLTHTTRLLQLRYGPDGRWYPYRADSEDGEWWPEGPSAADPLTAMSAALGEG
ncbi:SWIM zinc finger family protein [Streptomyces sp. NBC_01187]|uniref:SWIM zinc finger family protein n=1 Tax=Streptomyces sp. NBC_01187 TaxID=2903766 RepID=UPI003867D812|nr:SWIM zinc finger family protein [Streptomyces sp. NBC_01187]